MTCTERPPGRRTRAISSTTADLDSTGMCPKTCDETTQSKLELVNGSRSSAPPGLRRSARGSRSAPRGPGRLRRSSQPARRTLRGLVRIPGRAAGNGEEPSAARNATRGTTSRAARAAGLPSTPPGSGGRGRAPQRNGRRRPARSGSNWLRLACGCAPISIVAASGKTGEACQAPTSLKTHDRP